MSRARTALPLVLTYWVVLLLGLVLYTAARRDATDIVTILWAGSVFGTLVGHLLGLTNVRLWFTAIVVGGLVLLGLAGPASPDRNVFWMSFAPATIFAAISVGDRWSLAAFWFPAMIWMLTILDGTNGKSTPDGTAAVTLGALALAFVVFLRVRETRRVALWKTVAARPLATPAVSTVFKEPPGKEVSRAFWMLGTSAAVFAFTAWLAPQLWEVETFGADPKITASSMGPDGDGPPCCEDLAEAERSRVKEYFDFGRGRDSLTGNTETQCRQCYPDDDGGGGGYAGRLDYCTDTDFELGYCIKCTSEDIERGLCVLCTNEQIERGVCVYGRWVGSGYGGGGGGGGGAGGAGGAGGHGGTGTGGNGGIASNWNTPTPHYEPPTTYTPPTYTPPTYTPPTPQPALPRPETIQPEPRQPEPQVAPTPVPQETPPTPAPSTNEPSAPEPQIGSAPPKTDRPAPSATRAQKPAAQSQASGVMRWLSAFVAAIIALQLLRFLFRPLRRAIHLRHLRKPFWEETVDQRVSNWWQLVLVGLRDAGYRTSSDEQPREFARRTGVEGVEKAAAILDRTRHGIRVDQDDLEEMSTASEAAYRSARENTSTLARAAAQIRWPLA